MITLASIDDKNDIMALIRSATEELNKKGIYQWDEIYPDTDVIERDILSKTLHKYIVDNSIAAVVVINTHGSPEYETITWDDKSPNYVVIHRLTVHPKYQGRGIAKKMMNHCEKYALENNKSSIRLDTFIKNVVAVNLYKKLNYAEKGTIHLRKGEFYCFEKVLT